MERQQKHVMLYTSRCMQRTTWNTMTGIFNMWPPISCRLQNLSWCLSSSGGTTRPLFQSRYLIEVEDEAVSLARELLWITGLDHFVQTRKAKHSAILQANHFSHISPSWLFPPTTKLLIQRNTKQYPIFINKSHQLRAAISPVFEIKQGGTCKKEGTQ